MLILNCRKTKVDNFDDYSIDVFTCGQKYEKNGTDFKYGMMNLKVEKDKVINI